MVEEHSSKAKKCWDVGKRLSHIGLLVFLHLCLVDAVHEFATAIDYALLHGLSALFCGDNCRKSSTFPCMVLGCPFADHGQCRLARVLVVK